MDRLTPLFKIKYGQNIEIVGSRAGDEVLNFLSRLKNLKSVALCETSVTDKGLRVLSRVATINILFIGNCPKVTNQGVEQLFKLPQLRALTLYDMSAITDLHLQRIWSSQLRDVDLTGTQVTDHTMHSLRNSLPNLNTLVLDRSAVTDACFSELQRMPKLKSVSVTGTRITEEAKIRFTKTRPDIVIVDSPG